MKFIESYRLLFSFAGLYIVFVSFAGLGMKFIESDKSGNQFFTFEHSPAYQEVQHRFLKAVDSLNPEFIVVSTVGI